MIAVDENALKKTMCLELQRRRHVTHVYIISLYYFLLSFLLGSPGVLWLTLESPVLEVDSDVVKEMAVDVSTRASSDVPVSEDGSCFCHANLDIFIFKDSHARII